MEASPILLESQEAFVAPAPRASGMKRGGMALAAIGVVGAVYHFGQASQPARELTWGHRVMSARNNLIKAFNEGPLEVDGGDKDWEVHSGFSVWPAEASTDGMGMTIKSQVKKDENYKAKSDPGITLRFLAQEGKAGDLKDAFDTIRNSVFDDVLQGGADGPVATLEEFKALWSDAVVTGSDDQVEITLHCNCADQLDVPIPDEVTPEFNFKVEFLRTFQEMFSKSRSGDSIATAMGGIKTQFDIKLKRWMLLMVGPPGVEGLVEALAHFQKISFVENLVYEDEKSLETIANALEVPSMQEGIMHASMFIQHVDMVKNIKEVLPKLPEYADGVVAAKAFNGPGGYVISLDFENFHITPVLKALATDEQ